MLVKERLCKTYIVLCLMGIILLSIYHIVVGFNNQMDLESNMGFGALVGFVLFYIPNFLLSFKIKRSKRIWSISLLGLYIAILFLLSVVRLFDLTRVLGFVLWVFCFYFGDRVSKCSVSVKQTFLRTAFVGISLLIAVFLYYYYSKGFLENQKSSDMVFCLIVYIPLLFLFDGKKILKIVAIALFSVICFLSLKRSIVLGLTLFMIVLFLLEGNKKIITKWYFWLIVIAVIYVGSYLIDTVGNLLDARFHEESGGSGRDLIYANIFHRFSNSEFFQLLFGHGFMSVIKINGALAHNDFLQLLYDGGLIAIVFYLSMWVYLLSFVIKNWRIHRQIGSYYSVYVSTIVLLLLLSMLNCFIYSYILISPMMLAIGFLIGEIRNKKRLLFSSNQL